MALLFFTSAAAFLIGLAIWMPPLEEIWLGRARLPRRCIQRRLRQVAGAGGPTGGGAAGIEARRNATNVPTTSATRSSSI